MNKGRSRQLANWLAAVTATLALATVAHGAGNTTQWRVAVDGEAVEATPPPRLSDGHVLLPADLLSSALGIVISHDERTGVWALSLGGRALRLRTWQRDYEAEGGRRRAAWPPELVGDTLYVPIQTLRDALGLDVSSAADNGLTTVRIQRAPVRVTGLRYGRHETYFRLVLDLDGAPSYTWSAEGQIVQLTISNAASASYHRRLTDPDELVRWVDERQIAGGPVQVEIVLTRAARVETFVLKDPPRLVVDISRHEQPSPGGVVGPQPPVPTPPRPWAGGPGATHERRTFSTPAGAVSVNVVRVDLSVPGVEVRPGLAASTVREKARVSSIARRSGASVAINGGFFAREGPPLGALLIDHEWVKHPIKSRMALCITDANKAAIQRLFFRGSVTLPQAGELALNGLNCGHEGEDEAVLYTGRWGGSVGPRAHTVRAAVSRAQVVERVDTTGAATAIPADGYVLSCTGGKARQLAKVQVGTTLNISLGTTPAISDLRHAIGGGPCLVHKGAVCVTAELEGFRSDVKQGRSPRTAVGLDAQNRLLLVTVDGREANGSTGMTLNELATTMRKLGAVEAMNLDGGSSSTMVINGRVVNVPSTGGERGVSNALLVFLPHQTTEARKP